ncbi:Hypothetical protein D9617_21g098160 [Elsinoe fawcettii]|nr:Hypothetical protein D9617_21g098160 [Elsinoe fawcettii]
MVLFVELEPGAHHSKLIASLAGEGISTPLSSPSQTTIQIPPDQHNNQRPHKSSPTGTMQPATILLLISSLGFALANPAPAAAPAAGLEDRATCNNPSGCSTGWSKKCEWYCETNHGKFFDHMTGSGCIWPAKKCCCK